METSTHCTNVSLGQSLGLSDSAVSRMRAGTRFGSLETLTKLAALTGSTMEDVTAAVITARQGNLAPWLDILERACQPAEAVEPVA